MDCDNTVQPHARIGLACALSNPIGPVRTSTATARTPGFGAFVHAEQIAPARNCMR